MIKKVWNFVSDRGYVFMLAGIVIVIAAALMLIRYKQAGEQPGAFLWPVITIGLIIYIIGRIGVFDKNRRKQNLVSTDDSQSDE